MCIKTHQNALFSRETFKTHLSQYQEHCMCIQIFTTDEMSFNFFFLGGRGSGTKFKLSAGASYPRYAIEYQNTS